MLKTPLLYKITKLPKKSKSEEKNVPIIRAVFAKADINVGKEIMKITGNFVKKSQTDIDYTNTNTNYILVKNGWIFIIDDKCHIKFCRDNIFFPTTKRNYDEIIESNNPFYTSNVYTNTMIKVTSDTEAYLIAMRGIRRGSEIFYHRGFTFWAAKEIEQFGINNKINLLNSASFDEYIRIFYGSRPISHNIIQDYDDDQLVLVVDIEFSDRSQLKFIIRDKLFDIFG